MVELAGDRSTKCPRHYHAVVGVVGRGWRERGRGRGRGRGSILVECERTSRRGRRGRSEGGFGCTC